MSRTPKRIRVWRLAARILPQAVSLRFLPGYKPMTAFCGLWAGARPGDRLDLIIKLIRSKPVQEGFYFAGGFYAGLDLSLGGFNPRDLSAPVPELAAALVQLLRTFGGEHGIALIKALDDTWRAGEK